MGLSSRVRVGEPFSFQISLSSSHVALQSKDVCLHTSVVIFPHPCFGGFRFCVLHHWVWPRFCSDMWGWGVLHVSGTAWVPLAGWMLHTTYSLCSLLVHGLQSGRNCACVDYLSHAFFVVLFLLVSRLFPSECSAPWIRDPCLCT